MDGEGDKMTLSVQIHPFNTKEASQAEYAALNQHNNLLRHEYLPDDPPIPLEESIQELKNLPPFVELKMWCAWDVSHREIIADGYVGLLRMEENQHLAQIDITVQPEYRRQGLGRQLLALLTEAAHADNRRLLMTQTYDRIPAGEAFLMHLGAQKGLEGHVNQLRIAELDHSLVERWLEQGRAHAAEFELGLWDGSYPEEQLAAVAQLVELTNQQPFGDLEIGDMHMTPEQLRQSEQQLFSRGSQRWTFYVIDKAIGRFVGYSETVWNPNRPEILRQDMTGVFPEYRNKGLGRWLKAAMLEKVLKERPQVKYVRTGNADVNAAMLKINNELGFRPYMANTLWQVEVDRVLTFLRRD
jgi:GNAT superfamily N-acetyltransferase